MLDRLMSERKKVLIVDDHPMLRIGLRNLLEGSGRYLVSGEAGTAANATRELERGNADCAIVDLMLKGKKRLDLLKTMREIDPDLPIVVLSMLERDDVADSARRAGASLFVSKDESPARVLDVLDELFPETGKSSRQQPRLAHLTPRERSVFELLGCGMDKHDITKVLGISVKTVETHRESLKRKLSVPTIRDLVRTAVQSHQTS